MQLSLEDISTPDDPKVRFFRDLKGNHPRLTQEQLILVEGDLQVERLLSLKLPLHTLFFEPHLYDRFAPLLSAYNLNKVRCYRASRDVMEQLVGYRLHQGCMALTPRPQEVPLSELPLPAVAFFGLSDPENIGSILRSALAFGIPSVIVDAESCDPYIRRAIRVSLGAALSLSVTYVDSLVNALPDLRKRARILAAELSTNSRAATEKDFSQPFVLILGNERRGISEELLQAADQTLHIPMDRSLLSSLNVGAAAAVLLSKSYTTRSGL